MTIDVKYETKFGRSGPESEAYEDSTSTKPMKSFGFLLEKINSIQDIMLKSGLPFHELNLPQICVVGSQSVGKSSVLESFVGREFLPRGKGIVTRRPLLLQLRNIPGDDEFGEFEHISGKRFFDFNEICEEIVRETNDSLGRNSKCIGTIPIRLKISSPYVVDLTVIDLPGVTKVPVGNQPVDIEQITRDLVISFIENKSCIILAVSSATEDLANSVALGLARQVDPEHQRTFGVITKIDCLGEGHDVVDSLLNRTYRLKFGYIGVVFRDAAAECQSTIREARKDEMEFFESRKQYRQFLGSIGSEHLSKVLNKRLLLHIKDSLPGTLLMINKMIDDASNEIGALGLNLDENEVTPPSSIILNAIMEFVKKYKDLLDGRITDLSLDDEFVGGAKISNRLHTEFPMNLENIDEATQISDEKIRIFIKNASGIKCHIFMPEQAFETLVNRRVIEFKQPALSMVKKISDDMTEILENSQTVDTIRYDNLAREILHLTKCVVQKCLGPTRQVIENLFQMEMCYINLKHPDFIVNRPEFQKLRNSQTKNVRIQRDEIRSPDTHLLQVIASGYTRYGVDSAESDGSDANENYNLDNLLSPDDFGSDNHVAMIKRFVESYVKLVRMNVTDSVPKTIMTFLVKRSYRILQEELITNLFKPEKYEYLLARSDECVLREQMCRSTYKALIESREKLEELLRSEN